MSPRVFLLAIITLPTFIVDRSKYENLLTDIRYFGKNFQQMQK